MRGVVKWQKLADQVPPHHPRHLHARALPRAIQRFRVAYRVEERRASAISDLPH
jgi:hypothetical protein